MEKSAVAYLIAFSRLNVVVNLYVVVLCLIKIFMLLFPPLSKEKKFSLTFNFCLLVFYRNDSCYRKYIEILNGLWKKKKSKDNLSGYKWHAWFYYQIFLSLIHDRIWSALMLTHKNFPHFLLEIKTKDILYSHTQFVCSTFWGLFLSFTYQRNEMSFLEVFFNNKIKCVCESMLGMENKKIFGTT